MFTGIIQEKAPLRSLRVGESESCVLRIESSHPQRKSWKIGDSIAIDGACLTIVALEHADNSSLLTFDVSKETLARTHFPHSFASDHPRLRALHLEPALKMGDPLGGHMVSGHIEDVARVEERSFAGEGPGRYLEMTISVPRDSSVAPFLIPKGSICLDGASLTLNKVWDEIGKTYFTIFLIPHTIEQCHFDALQVGDFLNIESDLMARHFARYQDMRRH